MTGFLRLFKCDVRNGVRSTRKTIIVTCGFLLLLILSFYMRIGDMALTDEVSLAKELVRCGPFSSGDYLAYLFNTTLSFAPGAEYRYSDAAYYLLSRAVTEKTGCALDDFLWRELLLPPCIPVFCEIYYFLSFS